MIKGILEGTLTMRAFLVLSRLTAYNPLVTASQQVNVFFVLRKDIGDSASIQTNGEGVPGLELGQL